MLQETDVQKICTSLQSMVEAISGLFDDKIKQPQGGGQGGGQGDSPYKGWNDVEQDPNSSNNNNNSMNQIQNQSIGGQMNQNNNQQNSQQSNSQNGQQGQQGGQSGSQSGQQGSSQDGSQSGQQSSSQSGQQDGSQSGSQSVSQCNQSGSQQGGQQSNSQQGGSQSGSQQSGLQQGGSQSGQSGLQGEQTGSQSGQSGNRSGQAGSQLGQNGNQSGQNDSIGSVGDQRVGADGTQGGQGNQSGSQDGSQDGSQGEQSGSQDGSQGGQNGQGGSQSDRPYAMRDSEGNIIRSDDGSIVEPRGYQPSAADIVNAINRQSEMEQQNGQGDGSGMSSDTIAEANKLIDQINQQDGDAGKSLRTATTPLRTNKNYRDSSRGSREMVDASLAVLDQLSDKIADAEGATAKTQSLAKELKEAVKLAQSTDTDNDIENVLRKSEELLGSINNDVRINGLKEIKQEQNQNSGQYDPNKMRDYEAGNKPSGDNAGSKESPKEPGAVQVVNNEKIDATSDKTPDSGGAPMIGKGSLVNNGDGMISRAQKGYALNDKSDQSQGTFQGKYDPKTKPMFSGLEAASLDKKKTRKIVFCGKEYEFPVEMDIIQSSFDNADVRKNSIEKVAEINAVIDEAKRNNKLYGHDKLLEGSLDREGITDVGISTLVNWKRMLKKWLRETTDYRYTYNKPNKKAMAVGVTLPGRQKISDIGDIKHLKIYIDTSGSFSDEDVRWALSEVVHMLNQYHNVEGELIYWSNECTSYGYFHKKADILNIPITSLGGTDIYPVFDHLYNRWKKDKQDIGCVLIITDGYFDYDNNREEVQRLDKMWSHVHWLIASPHVNRFLTMNPKGKVYNFEYGLEH